MNKSISYKIVFICLFTGVFNACIEPFTPNIGDGAQYLVINGTVTDEEGYQYVEISKTSSYADREYLPLNDCEAKVIDGMGNIFTMENYSDGQYRTWIDKNYLQTGNTFKLQVICNGKTYESEYDSLLPCPEIERVYYDYTEIVPDDPTQYSTTGLQFYIDYDATGDYADNYRWEFEETWEYHAQERTFIIYKGIVSMCCDDDSVYSSWDPCYELNKDTCWYWLNLRFLSSQSAEDSKVMDSLYTCWKTSKVREIITYTSRQKRDKKVMGLPLNIVTNRENRLTIKYSLLVKQLTLSDMAFEYWNQLQEQSQETGGLYETQPYQLKGNIRCIEDEEENVIGIFNVSSVKTKRLTTSIHMNPNEYYCHDVVDGWERLQIYLWGGEPPGIPHENIPDTPLYLHPFFNANQSLRRDTFSLIDQSCIDCRLKGGTIIKPDFW